MNLFSAVCAATTLGVLARSVAILPHDRTEMERNRERSDFAFLTGWMAWVPPLAAVIFAGFQLGFWEHATSFSGESFQLLWFALIIWQWLEYRLDEAEWRLYLTAFLFGSGLADNWALLGFIPLFLMAIIWLKKLSFFRFDFLGGMTLWGLAGLVFFLLLPLVAKLSANYHVSFWEELHDNLRQYWVILKGAQQGFIRKDLALDGSDLPVPGLCHVHSLELQFRRQQQAGPPWSITSCTWSAWSYSAYWCGPLLIRRSAPRD